MVKLNRAEPLFLNIYKELSLTISCILFKENILYCFDKFPVFVLKNILYCFDLFNSVVYLLSSLCL